jgi:hypothetical protein
MRKTLRGKLPAFLLALAPLLLLCAVLLPYLVSAQDGVTKAERDVRKGVQRPDGHMCHTCPPPTARRIYAPVSQLKEAAQGEIVLNSRSPRPIDITPTLYTAEGEALVGPAVQLQPAEIRFVPIDSLLPADARGHQHLGGIALSYTGGVLEIWAQITFQGVAGNGGIDETFNILEEHGSNTQEAVWLAPAKSTALIALGNSSDAPAHAVVQFGDGELKELDIAPFATEYLRRRRRCLIPLKSAPSGRKVVCA